MTQTELASRISAIQTSEAPFHQKDAAIKALESKYSSDTSKKVALKQFYAALPDTSDFGGHS